VELGEYKGVEVEKVEVNVTDEDVEKELKAVAEKERQNHVCGRQGHTKRRYS